MIFYAQNAIFSHFFLRSRLIWSIILIEIWPKDAKKDFYSTLQHFQWYSTPPLTTAADLWFFMPKTLIFLIFFLRSRLISSIILIDIWSKHAKKDFYFTSPFNTFNDILHPPPRWQSPRPPKVKSWIRHCICPLLTSVTPFQNMLRICKYSWNN